MKYLSTLVQKFLVFFVFPFSIMTVSLLALPKKILALDTYEGQGSGGGDPLGNSGGGDPIGTTTNGGGLGGTTGANNTSYHLENPLRGVDDIGSFIKKILDIVLTIGIPIVALFIIYSGFLFVVARGNDEKLTEAKKTLGYTLLGAAILLGSWVLAKALGSTVEQLQ